MIFSLVFALLFSHPLEKELYPNINITDFSEIVCVGNNYLSPFNGFVKSIISENGKYTIKTHVTQT
jgi:hypothetical protein